MKCPATDATNEASVPTLQVPPPLNSKPTGHPPAPLGDDGARRILAASMEILHQGVALLGGLSPEVYAAKVPEVFNASIGAHYRHCLDHVASLLDGFGTQRVDYDDRARDPQLEREPEFARAMTRQLLNRLELLPPGSLASPVSVRCEVSYGSGDAPVTQSTLGRELVYAIAHGIHHYALISVIARLLNVPLPPNFGVAPSTVTHLQTVAGS
ncbi:MAG: hypothetical protein RIS76_3497 [Verrucomicrobiota bacterium]